MGKKKRSKRKSEPKASEPEFQASPEVLAIVRAQRYDRRAPLAKQLPVLEEMKKLDLASEEAGGTAGCTAMVLLPLMVAAGFGAWITGFGPRAESFALPLRVGAGLLFLGLAGGFFYQAFRAVSHSLRNIPNGLRQVLLPVLEDLAKRLPDDAEVRVDLDLSGPLARGKKISDTGAGIRGFFRSFYKGESKSRHEDPWGTVEAPLEGGTLFLRFRDEYHCRSRQVSDTSSSNGYKTVEHWRKYARVEVALEPSRGEAPEPIQLEDMAGGDAVPDKDVAPSKVKKAVERMLRAAGGD